MTLHRYIFRQLLWGTAFATGGMAFVAVPGLVVSAVQKLGGVGMGAALGYLPLVLVDLVPYLVPIAFLLTVVATYGRLAADNEWAAMNMAGFSPLRLALPAVLVATIMGAGTYYLVGYVSPHLSFVKRDYVKRAVVAGLKKIAPGRTKLNFPGTDFYMSARWREQGGDQAFRDVLIHVPPEEGSDEEGETIRADWLTIRFQGNEMIVSMRDARRVHGDQDTFMGESVLTRNMDQVFAIDHDSGHWKFQNSARLREMIDHGEIHPRSLSIARIELHSRYATAATCLLFVLLGIPTGLLLRSGTRLGALATAVGYALLYYLLSMRMGKELAASGSIPEWLGAWSTTFLGVICGLGLARKAMFR